MRIGHARLPVLNLESKPEGDRPLMKTTRSRIRVLTALAAGLLLGAAASVESTLVGSAAAGTAAAKTAREASADLPERAEQLARESERLRRELELSESPGPVLALDPARSRLYMKFQGVLLREFPVISVEVGRPRIFFLPEPSDETWRWRIWEDGVCVPEPKVRAQADSLIPLLPEERVPAPRTFRVRFAEGRVLEVHSVELDDVEAAALGDTVEDIEVDGTAAGNFESPGMMARISDFGSGLLEAVRPVRRESLRLRITLSNEDAGALYRALPPSVRLLIR